jgi:hypothetical protein
MRRSRTFQTRPDIRFTGIERFACALACPYNIRTESFMGNVCLQLQQPMSVLIFELLRR